MASSWIPEASVGGAVPEAAALAFWFLVSVGIGGKGKISPEMRDAVAAWAPKRNGCYIRRVKGRAILCLGR
jgi:hypothetical protein